MQSTLRRKAGAVLAATAVTATTVVLSTSGSAGAAGDPAPWEPTSQAVGTITFYDSTGNAITSGSTNTAPFAAFAVGSTVVRTGDAQAGLFFANPDPSADPSTWSTTQDGLFAANPIVSGPSSVVSQSATLPTAVGGNSDETLEQFEANSVISTNPDYMNVVQVRLKTANSASQVTPSYDSADLLVDSTTHTWTEIYPTGTAPTSTKTTLKAAPSPAKEGATVTLTATEKPAAPGKIQFMDGTKKLGAAVTVSAGKATKTTSTLAVGSHKLSAVFTPTDASSFSGSTGKATEVIQAVPDKTSLTITGPASVKKGAKATFTGKLTDTTTKKAIANATLTLYRRANAKGKFAKVTTAKTSKTGVATASVKVNAAGQYEWKYTATSAHAAATSPVKSVTLKKAKKK